MNNSCNPFVSVGTIVSANSFIGRDVEIRKIRERVLGPEFGNMSIVGIPKIGKSSLMHEALYTQAERLWAEKKYIVIWHTLKLTPADDVSSNTKLPVFLNLVESVYRFLKRHGQNDVIDAVQEYYDVIKDPSIIWAEFEQNVLYFFEELVYSQIRVIYCIDEFDYSKDVLTETEYQFMRELSYRNSNKIGIVTTSRRSIYDIEHYSGGGSNFYGTFEYVYLKPFSVDDHTKQCKLVPNIAKADITQLFDLHGGHPYINALILKNCYQGVNLDDSNSNVNQEILHYYEDLFYVLAKDDLADKVDKLYCGFNDGVTEAQENYIYNCYGIFTEDVNGYMIPYSDTFERVLSQRYRENPFSLIWPEAERCIRKSITYALTEEYGDEDMSLWVDEIEHFPGINLKSYDQWVYQMKEEIRIYNRRASRNIIDQLYPKDYIVFFSYFWTSYLESIFGHNFKYWESNLKFIAQKIRNPEMHSRKNLILPQDQEKAKLICEEIIARVRTAGI